MLRRASRRASWPQRGLDKLSKLWVCRLALHGRRCAKVPRRQLQMPQTGFQANGSKAGSIRQREYESMLRTLTATSAAGPLPGRARLRSCSGPYAGAWLTTCPSTEQLRLTNSDMLCALRRRLGLAVLADAPVRNGHGCNQRVDAHGHHRLACTRSKRAHGRHRGLIAAWRQVFVEAGGAVPDRNIERMLRDTHVPVPPTDMRRLDLIVPGLGVDRGLPSFCDVTCVTPIAGRDFARPWATTINGTILRDATRDNVANYRDFVESGLGSLLCLGCEVFGQWVDDVVRIMPAMADEKARGMPPLVRLGATQALAAIGEGIWLSPLNGSWRERCCATPAQTSSRPSGKTAWHRGPARQRVPSGWMDPGRRLLPAASRGRLSQLLFFLTRSPLAASGAAIQWLSVMPRWVSKNISSRTTHYIRCRPSPSPTVNVYNVPACPNRARPHLRGSSRRLAPTHTRAHAHTHTHARPHPRPRPHPRAHPGRPS